MAKGEGAGMDCMGLTPCPDTHARVSEVVLGCVPSEELREMACKRLLESVSVRPSTALHVPA